MWSITLLILGIAIVFTSAQIDPKITSKTADVLTTLQNLNSTVNLRIYDMRVSAQALGDARRASISAVNGLLPPFLADPLTNSSTQVVQSNFANATNFIVSAVSNWQSNVTTMFNNMVRQLATRLSANMATAFGAVKLADTNITFQFGNATAPNKAPCQGKYGSSTVSIVETSGEGFKNLMNAELTAYSRTLTKVVDFTNIAANNLQNMADSISYCTGIGLARRDLRLRVDGCFRSFSNYAFPQLMQNLALENLVLNRTTKLEAGSSFDRMLTGFNMVVVATNFAAQQLPLDVRQCLLTGA